MLPLVTLEDQVEGEMAWLGLPYVNVTSTPLEALEEQIQNTQPGRLDRVQALLSRSLALATRNLPGRPVYAELCNFEHNQP